MDASDDSPSKENPKLRRPLPTPGSQPPPQRPSTPIPIPPSAFYGETAKSQQPPALPRRPAGVGSSATSYMPPVSSETSSLVYNAAPGGYREPELVKDDRIDEDEIPPLTSDNAWDPNAWDQSQNTWGNGTPWDNWNANNSTSNRVSTPGWHNHNNNWDWGKSAGTSSLGYGINTAVPIDDRNEFEESLWWDPAERNRHGRPGPGMLPPVLADELHDFEHTLYSLNVTPPDLTPQPQPEAQPSTPGQAERPTGSLNTSPANSSTSLATSSPFPSRPKVIIPGPTPDDVREAVPHPNAYYCSKENGWVIFNWKSSSVVPPLAQSFQKCETRPHPLPEQMRRKRTLTCVGDEENIVGGPSNKTHHFHKYPNAVDALKLTPPYRVPEWEVAEVRQRRRAGTILTEAVDLEKMKVEVEEVSGQEEEGLLLDLYMCCQCSFYCVASTVQPGVVPADVWKTFIHHKMTNPPPGRLPEHSVVLALETLLKAIESLLWKSERRALRVIRPGFQGKIGWSSEVQRIFECIGFTLDKHEHEPTLKPPPTDLNSAASRQSRAKLLRVWVEIGAWTAQFKKINGLKLKEHSPHKLWVGIDNAREMHQTAIGAHHDQISRANLSDTLREPMIALDHAFRNLGLTPTSYSEDLLSFAYLSQCRCDPAGTMKYFTSFSLIVKVMEQLASCPTQLQDLLIFEQSRGRFTEEELQRSTEILGFGADGALRVEYDHDIEEEFIENAWKECVKRSWLDPRGGELQRDANEALRMIAESRSSTTLKELYEKGKNSLMMTPERAYDVLEVPSDTDDSMLITVFTMRLDEQPSQIERMQEALNVIAEVRNSDRLREFIRTSQDPGEAVVVTPADWPRGLNQLGNTCYLNSLLQYFYTIKDLREAVIPLGNVDLKSIEDEKLSDDALSKHRVGGRLVTRKEIQRSKKFVNHLAALFSNLEHSQSAAVTPAIELAKLALVTSKDEEDDEVDHGGTDSSNDTDATLVEDGPSRFSVEAQTELPPTSSPPPHSPTHSPSSILGKRQRRASEMDIDSLPLSRSPSITESPHLAISRASSVPNSHSESSKRGESSAPVSTGKDAELSKDVEMEDASQNKVTPPLPPRKAPVKSDSMMMFGRQHDVAECMDNCMFQIETALLKFDGMVESTDKDEDTTSIVKRLFYGKLRQQFVETVKGQPTIHKKEDVFAHLPVNVAEESFDIYDGLGRYFDDTIEYEGQRVPIEVSLLTLPPLLQIQLQRVQFNRELVQSWKSQAYVKFGETIYMDRFMASADPEKRKKSKTLQEELQMCRERIRILNRGQDISFGTVLDNTSKFLSDRGDILKSADVPVDEDLPMLLANEREAVKAEIEELRARITRQKEVLEDLWKDDKSVPYELTSVFIHRGTSPSFGHYFFYSRNLPSNPDEWFKYNDSDVSKISKDEVLQDTTGSTANPYLLVFARKGFEVVDTVRRSDQEKIAEIDS